jgi:hypothetical protein
MKQIDVLVEYGTVLPYVVPRSLHIFRPSLSGISVWRGTVEDRRASRMTKTVCRLPSLEQCENFSQGRASLPSWEDATEPVDSGPAPGRGPG